jgi:hypothetical protein
MGGPVAASRRAQAAGEIHAAVRGRRDAAPRRGASPRHPEPRAQARQLGSKYGDKFFAYSTAVSRKAGAGLSAVTVGRITGGTGKFANMRGTIYTVRTADPAAGINEGQTEVEYVLGLETDARDARKEAPRPPTTRPGQR